jgi:dolichol kinase
MISKIEIRRKIVHLTSLSIPVGYGLTSEKTALLVLSLLFLGFLVVDLLRRYHPRIKSFFGKYIIGKILREGERTTFMGSTYFLFSSLLTIFFFPESIAISSILILILSDTAAALVGKSIGRVPVFGKTLEGSIAFFVCSLLIVWSYPNLDRVSGSLAALGATLVEILPLRLDDNLTIPLAAGAIMLFLGG